MCSLETVSGTDKWFVYIFHLANKNVWITRMKNTNLTVVDNNMQI